MDRKGGDRWTSRGVGGVWSRLHLKPRRSLFTPFRVAEGPSSEVRLGIVRFTKGVTRSGKLFEFHDKWNDEMEAHRLLEEPWVGLTTFIERDKATLLDVQLRRREDHRQEERRRAPNAIRWADILVGE